MIPNVCADDSRWLRSARIITVNNTDLVESKPPRRGDNGISLYGAVERVHAFMRRVGMPGVKSERMVDSTCGRENCLIVALFYLTPRGNINGRAYPLVYLLIGV